ncbi:MAG TPA: hypothetical protein VK524_29005 [Polyangiaceae bacterium]|nr:hypothetical protein [Polyangiaceae bacterium]
MKVKALKSFQSRAYGFITAGSKFNCEPGYARDLVRNKLIEILEDTPGPKDNKAVPAAPARKQPTAPVPGAGVVAPPSSLEADLASRLLTSTPSVPGARRGKPRIVTSGARPAK